MTFTLHRVTVKIPNGSSRMGSEWDYELGVEVATERVCDFETSVIVFGAEAAWSLYRKTIGNIRKGYFHSDCDKHIVTIESALIPENGVVSAPSSFPYIGESGLKDLRWETIDMTETGPRA